MLIFYGPFLVELDGYDLREGDYDAVLQVGTRSIDDVDVSVYIMDGDDGEEEWRASVGGVEGDLTYSPGAAVEGALREYCWQKVKWGLEDIPVLDLSFLMAE
jgi:hypothetical protein